MLYDWLEAQRALLRSIDVWADLTSNAWGVAARKDPMLPPGCDWLRRIFQSTPEPPPFDIPFVTIDAQRVAVEESVVEQAAFCALRRFTRVHPPPSASCAAGTSILLCTPLAGHHAVMLRETVQTLLADADVYVTDWANARDVPCAAGTFGLDDYVVTIERFIRRLADDGLHVVAVCQATVPSLAAAALVADAGGTTPASLTLMGGPIDTRLSPTLLNRLAVSHRIEWFRDTVIDTVPAGYPGVGRRIYPGYLQHAAIVAAHPHRQFALEARNWKSRVAGDDAERDASLRALNEYSAVLDMDETYFLDTLRVIFQEQRLASGTWRVAGRQVRPPVLTATALCTVEGDHDDITGAGQTHAAHAMCSGIPDALRTRMTIAECDHYDLFTGPRWREQIHPALARLWRALAERGNQAANT